MLRSWIAVVASCLVLWTPVTAIAQTLRYFQVWSYSENAPTEEITAEALEERDLGYWQLEFDGEQAVLRGTYHGSDGTPWLTYRYVEVDGRVYADLFPGAGVGLASLGRKSTVLTSRAPRWPRHPD
jgi:hypothetical protein